MTWLKRGLFISLGSMSLAFACAPIEGSPLSEAPVNSGCPEINPCDGYAVKDAKIPAQCSKDGRCDYGRPDYPFTMVVNVPNSSFYAPGRTFVLTSEAFRPQPGTSRGTCIAPTCLQLPALVPALGRYRVTKAAADAVGLPLAEGTSLPVRVSFVPLVQGTDMGTDLVSLGIPVDGIFTSSRLVGRQEERDVVYIDALSLGDYRRIAYPEPPFDVFFPPAFTTLRVGERFVPAGISDDFVLGTSIMGENPVATPLDDDLGDSRMATVTRAEGLEGWRVWLEFGGRRISSLRTLAGKRMVVRLDTVGQRQLSSPSLKENVDVIVAPPEDWLGVPRLQSRLISGQGLEKLDVPPLPGPASVTGVVADGGGAADGANGGAQALTGIPSKLLFTSTSLRQDDGTLQPLLRYSAAVSTDGTGHFRTVLPPGKYDVTIEPDERTGYAKVKDTSFDTADTVAKTFRPPLRTVATGQVLLADGRPLAEADILAIPSDIPATGTAVKPRPARTRTDREGRFRFEADQGQFDLIVDPQPGTGFPRVLQVRSIGTGTADIVPIQVAPPARLSFVLRDPSQVGNPIVRAMVRVFAELPGRGPPAVEIGRAMTDDAGKVEILLAQQPR